MYDQTSLLTIPVRNFIGAPQGTIIPYNLSATEKIPDGWAIHDWPIVYIDDDYQELNPYRPDVSRLVMLVKL